MSPETLLAGLALAVCGVLLLRMALGDRRRTQFDLAALRTWHGLKQVTQRVLLRRSRRQSAQQAAQEAIRRAQRKTKGQWEGNVYTPNAFGQDEGPNKPPAKRDLH